MISLIRGFKTSFLNVIKINQNLSQKFVPIQSINQQQQQQIRGFKDKGILKLRCSSCYFKKLDDRWWVLCNQFPRHKQRQKVEDHRDKWIVTHLTRKGKPFQKKPEAYICNTSPPAPYDYKKRIWYEEEVKEGKWFPILKKKDYRF